MPLIFYLTSRFIRSKKESKLASSISLITIMGIALGIAVVIIALTILDGFEKTVQEKIVNLNSHIKITAFGNRNLPNPEFVTPKLILKYGNYISNIEPFNSKLAIIKSQTRTEGINLIGLHDKTISKNLGKYFLQGEKDSINIDSENHRIVLGKKLAQKLMIDVGSTVTIFTLVRNQIPSLENPPSIQQFIVSSIFESGMSEYDDLNAYINFLVADSLFGMNKEISGYNIRLKNNSEIEEISDELQDYLGYPYYVRSIYKVHQNIFTWLELQKEPIPIILGLIIIVAVFNIIGTLLMVVLEKTSAVGILRSMGLNRKKVLSIFVLHGVYLSIIGMIIGNILAFILSIMQNEFGLISLPDAVYFVTKVPISIELKNYAMVSGITFIVSIFAAILPALVASKIKPISAIRFD
ncbi:MAG: ABC transporter permease [Ignavibacteria bacterium]|nr:ABC transporter permease [Ignavibacteria bacterium]